MPAIPPTTSGRSPFKAGHSDPFKPRIHGGMYHHGKGMDWMKGGCTRMKPYQGISAYLSFVVLPFIVSGLIKKPRGV